MAKFVKQTSDIAESLNRLQGFAENLIAVETNRRIQLGREKEARMVDAYKYLISNEQAQIDEIEASLDSITAGLEERGIKLKDLPEQYKTIRSEELLNSASEGAVEMLSAYLRDTQGQKESYEGKRRYAQKVARHIDILEDNLAYIDPALYGDKKIVEAGDVAVAAADYIGEGKKYQDEVEDYITFRQTSGQLDISQQDWIEKLKRDIEAETVGATAEHSAHIGAIRGLEIPRQQIVETLNAKVQDPAMVLARHFGDMGVLKQQIADEDNTTKKGDLQLQLQQEYANLGDILYPQLMDADGDWKEPTPELQANMAEKLETAILILTKQKDPTQFIAYLEHTQDYYNEMKKDDSEQGRAVSNRIRGEVLSLLGIDLEVPIQFGDEIMSQIDIILAHYNELERIDLEQSFHGIQISKSIAPNVVFDTSYPESENTKASSFLKSKRK